MVSENPRSTARVMGHPIHPALVPFPIACFVGTLASDLVFWQTRDAFWATASFYLLGGGIVTALAAAVAGFTDFLGDRRIRAISHAWQHMIGNLVVVLLSMLNLMLRLPDRGDAILPLGLAISAAAGALLLFTGWRGGDLVFRHRVGIPDERREAG